MNYKKSAFTLVELSIVIVIIGLIIGGILVGSNLIKSSEIRAQIKQIEDFKTATQSFKLKYSYLPGDIPPGDAASLGFFTYTGTNAGRTYLQGGGPPNAGALIYGFGNNSGYIDNGENYSYWQHLSEANMISGSYGGSATASNYLLASTSTYSTGGKPVNAISNLSGYDIFLPQSKFTSADTHVYVLSNRPYVKITSYYQTPALNYYRIYSSAYQAYMIDSKIDDGMPSSGNAREGSGSVCVVSTEKDIYNLAPDVAGTDNCSIAVLW